MKYKIAVIGLGYVGLPLAVEFSKKFETIGFDINKERVKQLNSNVDKTNELDSKEISDVLKSKNLIFTSNIIEVSTCNIYIITVPTPINNDKTPNLSFLIDVSNQIGKILKKDDIVIYESTVYPGCTEEICVPELEKSSKLIYNQDFYCGYSPERINPGDKINTITKIKKVTSGSNPNIAKIVDDLYKSIITAGTHKASSIKVAEASKAIENAQRDLNISFVNELALIFDKIGIDTNEVLEAAATKWNFLKFKPGLVGGHCISVDPYYLVHKAKAMGYSPEVILSGRKVNDSMPKFIVYKTLKLITENSMSFSESRVLILGVTFKENCPDTRNSKIIELYNQFESMNINTDIYDPWVDKANFYDEYNIDLIGELNFKLYNVIIIAVAHDQFKKIDYKKIKKNKSIIFDLKSTINKNLSDARL